MHACMGVMVEVRMGGKVDFLIFLLGGVFFREFCMRGVSVWGIGRDLSLCVHCAVSGEGTTELVFASVSAKFSSYLRR